MQRNVLLIGLEKNKVAVSAFAKGRPAEGFETSSPSQENQALVQQDLQGSNWNFLEIPMYKSDHRYP